MTTHSHPGVMHVVDSLDLGGTETVAVNLANRLPRDRFRSFLCSTRPSPNGGPLTSALQGDVFHLGLDRKSRFDFSAMRKFSKFIRDENIQLLHVHGSSLFFSRLASLLSPAAAPRIIWHDHYGRCELNDRRAGLYRLAVAGANGVIAVNKRLVDWACRELHVSPKRVWYIPNFVMPPKNNAGEQHELPGFPRQRIVCLANLRPQKDHLTLIRAMAIVCQKRPLAHLLLIGAPGDSQYGESLRQEVARLQLQTNVSFLGQVERASSLLSACDVGVLSSASEGLPLSLLEYGWAGLPSIATSVGQCPEVLNHGNAGVLVDPGSPEKLAAAMLQMLGSRLQRGEYGKRFAQYVRETFDPTTIMNQICQIYDLVLAGN